MVNAIVTAGEGEVLKLGPPLRGEVTILVAPAQSNGAVAMGTQTLPSGETMERHRHLHCDEVWFVHKGQGRATVEGRTKTVVPGITVHIPRGAWHSLQNTGTGLLQIVWVSAPAGMEQLFRELSPQGAAPLEATALEAIAQRHGMEVSGEESTPPSVTPPSPRRHRHRRGRRGGGKGRLPVREVAAPAVPPSPATSEVPQVPVPVKVIPPRSQPPSRGSKGRSDPSRASSSAPRPPHAALRRRDHHRHGHAKEVYMGGRWIKVTGEGPIISTGGRDAIETPGGP